MENTDRRSSRRASTAGAEIGDRDWRLEIAAGGGRGVKWEIGDWRSEMCGVNESIAHLLEGLSRPPSPDPRIEIGDWRLEMENGDLNWIRQNMTLEIGERSGVRPSARGVRG